MTMSFFDIYDAMLLQTLQTKTLKHRYTCVFLMTGPRVSHSFLQYSFGRHNHGTRGVSAGLRSNATAKCVSPRYRSSPRILCMQFFVGKIHALRTCEAGYIRIFCSNCFCLAGAALYCYCFSGLRYHISHMIISNSHVLHWSHIVKSI